jgi:hypothetical protein
MFFEEAVWASRPVGPTAKRQPSPEGLGHRFPTLSERRRRGTLPPQPASELCEKKHFQDEPVELQIPFDFAQGRLSASLGMTKGRATLSWKAVARQKVFFVTLGGRRPMSTRDDKGKGSDSWGSDAGGENISFKPRTVGAAGPYSTPLRAGSPLPPDFLWNSVALANFMRLSLRKGAHAALSSAMWQEIRVRSGRDDNVSWALASLTKR